MDFSKFKIHDWLMVGGGAGMLIFGLFLDWASVDAGPFGGTVSGGNAFDFFFTGTVPWILLVGSGVVAFLLAAGTIGRDTAPWPTILLGTTVIGGLLVVIRVLIGPDIEGFDLDRGIGLYLSGIAGVVSAVGGYMNFTASGGDIGELTRSIQSKAGGSKTESSSGSSAASGDDTPPPPPPSS